MSTQTGRVAEQAAANYLLKKGFIVRDKNWRTRWCEIDIVAQKGNTMYFFEVKYRKNNAWGSGFDYITAKKLKQMAFAAEFWVNNYSWEGEFCLAAIEVSGSDYTVTACIEKI